MAYFFNKISIYSCLSSLLVIPILPIIIFLAIVNICLSVFSINIDFVGIILNFFVSLIIKLLTIINNLPASTLKVSIPFHLVMFFYCVIFSIIHLMYNKNVKQFITFIMLSICFYLIIDIIFLYKIKNNKSILVYRHKKHSNICFIDGFDIYLITAIDSLKNENNIYEFIYKGKKCKKFKVHYLDKDFYLTNCMFYKEDKVRGISYFMFNGIKGIYIEDNVLVGSKNDLRWIIINKQPDIEKLNKMIENYRGIKTKFIINGFNNYKKYKILYPEKIYFIGEEGYYQERIK